MANDLNILALCGRLTRDAETKYINNGKSITSFSLAVGYYGGTQTPDGVNYFDVDVWECKAAQWLIKGKQVAITGELRQERWDQDGQKRSKVKIIARSLQLLGSKDGGSDHGQGQASSGQTGSGDRFEDDIPF